MALCIERNGIAAWHGAVWRHRSGGSERQRKYGITKKRQQTRANEMGSRGIFKQINMALRFWLPAKTVCFARCAPSSFLYRPPVQPVVCNCCCALRAIASNFSVAGAGETTPHDTVT